MNKPSLTRPRNPARSRVASGLAAIAVVAGTLVATSAVTTAPASAATCRSYNYSYGGTSTCITYIQRMLNALSWGWGNLYYLESPHGKQLTVDGAYGANTKDVVTKFQQAERNLKNPLTVDGIVGPQTWSALCSDVLSLGAGESDSHWTSAVAAAHSAGC